MASMDLIRTVKTLGDYPKEAGKITRLGEGKFAWIIEDIISILTLASSVRSPNVTHSDTLEFYMQLSFENHVKLSFYSASENTFSITLGMNTGISGRVENHSGERNKYGIFQVRGWMSYVEFDIRRAEILKNGSLVVFCTLRRLDTKGDDARAAVVPVPLSNAEHNEDESAELDKDDIDEEKVAIQQWKTVKKMQEDMQNLLSKAAEDSDVTLHVQDKEFPAHRIILGARSAVFKSMFGHDTAESQSGEVIIIDCDPDTFPDFLTHVYTGSTRHLSSANVRSLYALADKYCMDSLKEDCVAFMKDHLTVDSFCDFVALALRHEEGELLEVATAFFRDHMPAIVKTPKWVRLLGENPKAANELLISATS